MQRQIKSNSGAYLLEIKLGKPFTISKGRFKGCTLPAGYYYYAGSAQKSLRQRVERHYRKDKILHWHIDHITASRRNHITNCWIFENAPKEMECRLTEKLMRHYGLKIVLKGFGSSDCRNCQSHLLASGQNPLANFSN